MYFFFAFFFFACQKRCYVPVQQSKKWVRLMFTLSIKQSDLDGVHNVRVAFGNGLRVDIWEEFKNRFKIPRIVEFFGATEGTGVFTNVTNTVGAIGRMSPLMVKQYMNDKNGISSSTGRVMNNAQ